RPWTWRAYRWLQLGMWCSLLLGPALVRNGVLKNQRDRPSLQWPHVTGTIFRSEWQYVARHTKGAFGSYSFYVHAKYYVGNRVSLWDPNAGIATEQDVAYWVAIHPIHSIVEVYYDPLHPDNCVLEPGADEERNRLLIWAGSILFVCTATLVFLTNSFL